MQIKDFKIVKKEVSQYSYIKFRRMFFGIIPIWIYLRETHINTMYNYTRYSIHVILLNIIALALVLALHFNPILLAFLSIFSVIYIVFALIWLYTDGNKIKLYGYHIVEDGKKEIVRFNKMFDKSLNKTSTIYSSVNEKNSKYYTIKIPRINFKKYLY